MRYLCVQCDEKFELGPADEVRCPKCMRVHGLRPLAAAPSAAAGPRKRRRILTAASAVVLLLLGGFVYSLWQRDMNPDPTTLATTPLSQRLIAHELERQGLKAGTAAQLFEPDAAVERFAQRAVAGKSTALDKAHAVMLALRERATHQAFVPWSLAEPREGPALNAGAVAAAIEKDGANKELYPLEVAALAVSALRAADVPAMLVEVPALPGERSPADPSGRFGYFGVALGDAKGAPVIFDAYTGKAEPIACGDCKLLSDLEAIGAALSLRATQQLAQNADPAEALRDADVAIKLWPSSAAVRSARAAILLANGAAELGQSEFEAAAQMRPDGPRRNNLAMLQLALGDAERATREVAQILEQQPDFALAHVTLAQIQLATGERESARAELDKAEALDPKLTLLPLTRAQYYAMGNANDQAIEQAKRAIAVRPSDPQSHLLLARIYRQASRYDDMRAEAKTLLGLVPAALTGRTRQMIEHLLGPTALEPTDAAPAPDTASPSSPSAGGPQPTDPSLPHVRLLDPSAGPSAGTLKPADGAPRLRLSDPGSGAGLQLKQP